MQKIQNTSTKFRQFVKEFSNTVLRKNTNYNICDQAVVAKINDFESLDI